MKDVVLIVDAMSLCKSSLHDLSQDSFAGLVDYGKAIPEPETTDATEALVFIIVGLTGHWRHPIAYFFAEQVLCYGANSIDQRLYWASK